MNQNKKIILSIAILLTISSFSISVISVNALSEGVLIQGNSNYIDNFNLVNNKVLPLEIETNSSIDVYLMNDTNGGRFLANLSYVSIYSWHIDSNLQFNLDPTTIANKFGLNFTQILSNNQQINVYILIINNGSSDARISVKYNPGSPLLSSLKDASQFALLGFTIYLTVYLYFGAKKHKKDNEPDKERIFTGFGFTFLFVSINYFVNLFQMWWSKVTNFPFFPDIKYHGVLLPFVTFRLDQVIPLTLFLFSDLFMIYTIEKIIGRKKFPIMTIMLIISIIMNCMVFIYPPIFDISVIVLFFAVLITLIQICYIYLTVYRHTRGKIRLKAISVLGGILIPIFTAMAGGSLASNMSLSYFIAYSLSIIAIFLIKFGLD